MSVVANEHGYPNPGKQLYTWWLRSSKNSRKSHGKLVACLKDETLFPVTCTSSGHS